MKKLLSIALGILVVPAIAASYVSAAGMGQIEGGDIYRAKNITKSTDFTDPVAATCNETVQFKVRIHNPGPSTINSVKVVATLPGGKATQHVSRVTVSSPNADPMSTSDTATVNLAKAGSLKYVAGSTELLDAHNGKLNTLADGIVSGGVTLPNSIGVSIEQKRFVQFSAKVDCPTPEVKKIKVCELATKKIVTINESDFDSKKHSKILADCAEAPKPGEITVCEIKTGNIVNIKEDAYDSSKHTKDLSDCEEEEVVATELPQTGANGMLVGIALSALVAGAVYTLQRRNILG